MRSRGADLYRLLYTSEADLPGPGDAQLRSLDAITAQARRRNRDRGLTGALLLVREHFIQVLEGPLDPLETVFETICCDFRHRRLRLVELAPAPERLFGEWSMACLAQNSEPTRLRLNRDLEELYFTVGINPATALKQMRDLLAGRQLDGMGPARPASAAG
jgi:hypothetical protein